MTRRGVETQFMAGLCFGILVYYFFVPSLNDIRMRNIQENLKRDNVEVHAENEDDTNKDIITAGPPDYPFQDLDEDKSHHHDNSTVADSLARDIRIFCVVLAKTVDLPKKSAAIHRTWAKRCTDIVYFAYNPTSGYEFPVVEIQSPERLIYYREKLKEVMNFISSKCIDDFEWFLIVTDETYVILENLRYFLSNKDFNEPTLYGRVNPSTDVVFKKEGLKWQYNLATPGFLMSKEAIRRVKSTDFPCSGKVTGDAYADLCMNDIGISVGSTKDTEGRDMFNCIPPEHLDTIHFPKNHEFGSSGKITVSDYAISFCMVNPPKQFGLEYHTYHLRAYGVLKQHFYG